ncbi:hypothetical protein GME_13445 [Halomonas sp. TD01]|nr:hypothetical protein GME_13445 [Halomonas sp. TD01]
MDGINASQLGRTGVTNGGHVVVAIFLVASSALSGGIGAEIGFNNGRVVLYFFY